MDLGLRGRATLVVGASRGIGAATARAFAEEGCRMALVARGREALTRTAESIREATRAEVLAIQADVTQPKDIETMVQKTLHHFGRIEILVNNVGASRTGAFLEVGETDWGETLDLNFWGAVRSCRAVVPHMIEAGGGGIVNVGSISGLQPSEGQLLSNVAKAALVNFSKTLAAELAPQRIRVNCVNPGRVHNERWRARARATAEKEGIPEKVFYERVCQAIPLRRFGEPEEVAAAIVFLASDRASYITGQSLYVDGGMLKTAF